MKRFLLMCCIASLPNLIIFAANPTLDSLLAKAAELRKAGKTEEARQVADNAVALAQKQQDWKHLLAARRELSYEYVVKRDYDRVLQLRLANLETFRTHRKAFNGSDEEWSTVSAVAAAYSWKHDYINAIRYCREEVALVEAMKESAGALLARSLQRLGINLYLAGQYAEAEKRMHEALDRYVSFSSAWTDPRDAARNSMQGEVMRWLERVMVAEKRYEEALETSEAMRSRGLAASLANRLTGDIKDVAAPSTARIKAIAREHNATLVEYAVHYQYDPDLLLLFSDFTDIPAETIYIWVIQPNGHITFHESPLSPQGPALEQMVQDARHAVGAFGRGLMPLPAAGSAMAKSAIPKPRALQDLYNLLIAPIAADLPQDPERLVTFVPQDRLFMVPLAALQNDAGHYLIEQHTVSSAPALSILDFTRRETAARRPAKGVLVVGNPKMPSLKLEKTSAPVQLSALPQAELEARAIAARFHAKPLIGEAATKSEVLRRMLGAQIVHLATHGLLDVKNGGLQGAVALAPAADDSGLLTVLEMQSLKINADLVVLSACDTAAGKVSDDGVLGFSRTLLLAGTPSLVVSLWAVPDESTSYLMEAFYQQLQRGEDKAHSLRAAMLATKQRFPNPGSWAAFTLEGESAVAPDLRNVVGDPVAISQQQLNLAVFTFPIPAGVTSVSQEPEADFEESVTEIRFDTTMTLPELFKFYKSAMENRGLKSVMEVNEARSFNLLYRGPWGDRDVGISGSDVSHTQPGTRSVSLDFSLRRDDAAEFSQADAERRAGLLIPPHTIGLRVDQRFEAVQGKADLRFLASLSIEQIRALYSPQFGKMGFVECRACEVRSRDGLTLEFRRPQTQPALFLSIQKNLSHPDRQEVEIRFNPRSSN